MAGEGEVRNLSGEEIRLGSTIDWPINWLWPASNMMPDSALIFQL